jgi:hypothetical protein
VLLKAELTEPPLSANPSTPKSVLLFATSETSPVGVPVAGATGATVMPTGTDDP